MKLLLDECTPARLRLDLPQHDSYTVEQVGLKGLKNGALLKAADGDFDVLITVDQHLRFQQNLSGLSIAIIVLVARSNRYSDLRTLTPKVLDALVAIKSGEIIIIRS